MPAEKAPGEKAANIIVVYQSRTSSGDDYLGEQAVFTAQNIPRIGPAKFYIADVLRSY